MNSKAKQSNINEHSTTERHTCLQNAENICCLLQIDRALKELGRFEKKLPVRFRHLRGISHQHTG